MTSAKGGLGKGMGQLGGQGLGALFGNAGVASQPTENIKDKVQEIEVEQIRPNRYQPREEFDEAALPFFFATRFNRVIEHIPHQGDPD